MGRNAFEQGGHVGIGQGDGDSLLQIGAGQGLADLGVLPKERHEAAVGIGTLEAGLDRLGQLRRLRADEEELGEGVADQQVLIDHQVGILCRQLAAFGEDFHQTTGEEIQLVAVIHQAKQVAVAPGIGGNACQFQDLVVGPAHPLCGFQFLEVCQGVDLVEPLLGIGVDEGEAQPFQATKQRDWHCGEGGFQRAGGTHPEHIDDLALGKRLLEAVLVEIEVDPLQLVGLPGVVERQFQQLELVFVVEIVDRSAGDLDGERLCLCQQWQAQAQPDEPFHALISCRIRDLPGV